MLVLSIVPFSRFGYHVNKRLLRKRDIFVNTLYFQEAFKKTVFMFTMFCYNAIEMENIVLLFVLLFVLHFYVYRLY